MTRPSIAVDMGATKVFAGVVDAAGQVHDVRAAATPELSYDGAVKTVAGLVAALAREHSVPPADPVGVAVATTLDRTRELVGRAPLVGWAPGRPLRADLREATGRPVWLENDANAAGWGEFAYGSAMGQADALVVTIGTGLGAGVIASGSLVRGALGMGGELGHLRVPGRTDPCRCGGTGCLELYVSGTALGRSARRLAHEDPAGAARMIELAGDARAVTARTVARAAGLGDEAALNLVAGMGADLGRQIGGVVAVLDPGVVVLGGGVASIGGPLVDGAARSLAGVLDGTSRPAPVPVKAASLGNYAGLAGVAALSRQSPCMCVCFRLCSRNLSNTYERI
jgi:glucokinase